MTGGRGAGPGAVAFSTHGGPGSIYAEAEEMRVVAGRHEHAAEEAAGASWQVDAAAFGLGRSATWLASAALLQDRLAEAVGRVRSLSEQCAELHRDLLSAAARYEEAERAAAGIMAAEDASLEELPGLLWRDGHDGLTTREAERLVQDLVQAVPEAIVSAALAAAGFPLLAALARIDVKMLTRAQKHVLKRPVSTAAKKGTDAASDLTEALRVSPDEAWTVAADALALAGAAPRGAVTPHGAPQDRPAAPARLDGSAAGLASLIPRGEGDGDLTVTEVVQENGSRAWVVGLPGTRGGLIPDPESTDPWDAGGLLDALGSESEVTAPAVRAALEAAGVPHGAPLVLAGYSQGGVHAVNLAGREDFTSVYPVAGVMTIAAPSGNAVETGRAAVLEFSADGDLAVAADGAPTPVSSRRAEVVFHPAGHGWDAPGGGFRTGSPLAVKGDLDAAHDFEGQVDLIRQFEAAEPAARAEVAGLSAALAGLTVGTVASSRAVRLRRTPPERDHLPPGSR
ncbi:hypothetical protein K7G68_09815 [Micrococcus luteus]|nr:hypothetical protein K7G68_09815 [Micrococcus luteus]